MNDNLLVFVFSASVRLKQKIILEIPLNHGIEDALMILILGALPILYLVLGIFIVRNFEEFKNPYTEASRSFGS